MLCVHNPFAVPAELAAPQEIAALACAESGEIVLRIHGAREIDGVAAIDGGHGRYILLVALHPRQEAVDIVHVRFGDVFRRQRHALFGGHLLDGRQHGAIAVAPMAAAANRMVVRRIEAELWRSGADLIQIDAVNAAFVHQS